MVKVRDSVRVRVLVYFRLKVLGFRIFFKSMLYCFIFGSSRILQSISLLQETQILPLQLVVAFTCLTEL